MEKWPAKLKINQIGQEYDICQWQAIFYIEELPKKL
jgi:hypothetical protein